MIHRHILLHNGLYFHSMKVRSYGFMNEPLVLKSSWSTDIYEILFKHYNAHENFNSPISKSTSPANYSMTAMPQKYKEQTEVQRQYSTLLNHIYMDYLTDS